MKTPSIALVIGSTRQGRFADKPVQWLLELAAMRNDFTLGRLDLRDYPLPFFDEAMPPAAAAPTNDAALKWQEALTQFDAFVFVTPEYNHGVPAVLKNALDYAYKEWNVKPAAFVGYGAVGAARSVQNLRLTSASLRMAPVSKAVHIGMAEFRAIRSGEPFADFPHLEQAAIAMFDELLWWTLLLKAGREQN